MSAPPPPKPTEAMYSDASMQALQQYAAEQGVTPDEAASQILSQRVTEMCVRPKLTRFNNVVRFPK